MILQNGEEGDLILSKYAGNLILSKYAGDLILSKDGAGDMILSKDGSIVVRMHGGGHGDNIGLGGGGHGSLLVEGGGNVHMFSGWKYVQLS